MKGLRGGLLLAALSGALAFAAAEAAVRILRPGLVAGAAVAENPFWRHDAELGWFHRPGQRGTFHREEFSHQVGINEMGFRDRERSLPGAGDGPASALRIAVLGDSFTWGHGVEDGEVFTRLLEAKLPGVEVWNLGVSAYSTDQELLLFRRFGASIRPGIVLLMFSRNDWSGNASIAYGAYLKPRFVRTDSGYALSGVPVPAAGPIRRGLDSIRRWSAFLNGMWLLAFDAGIAPDQRGGWEEQRAVTAFLLGSLEEEARRAGARLVVSNAPSIAHVYFPEVLESERRGDAFLRSWTEGAGVPYLDLVPGFRAAFIRSEARLHHQRDKHWNASGHALAADLLARLLADHGLAASHPGDS